MAISIIIIVVCLLGIAIYALNHASIKNNSFENKPSIYFTGYALQAKFKENYLWACEVCGVEKNLYDELTDNCIRHPILGIKYFTYYCTSDYSRYYPNISKCKNKIRDWDNTSQQESFANEFITIVEKLRSNFDLDVYELLNKYNLFDRSVLTKKFEVDNMQLFQLSTES